MTIVFANQKGGVGKSTLAVLFANYMSLIQNQVVVVLDMDDQRSIYNKAEAAKILENRPLYEVEAIPIAEFVGIAPIIEENKETFALLDLPGFLANDGLIPIFKSAGLIICPFAYDEFSVTSTIEFALVVKNINPTVDIVFVPNRIKQGVKYDTLTSVNEVLARFGLVSPPLSDRVDFQRITTFETPISVIKVVSPVFDLIYKKILISRSECQAPT